MSERRTAWAIFGPKDEWLCKVGHTEDNAWERISGAGYVEHYKQLGYTCRQVSIVIEERLQQEKPHE